METGPPTPPPSEIGRSELSLAAELRSSALLFGLSLAVTAGVASVASALAGLFS